MQLVRVRCVDRAVPDFPRGVDHAWRENVHEIFSATHKVGAAFETVSAKFNAETNGTDQPIVLGLCQASADRRRRYLSPPARHRLP